MLNIALDEVGGDYRDAVNKPNPAFLNAMLYVVVPLTGVMTVALLCRVASPGSLLSGLVPGAAGGGSISSPGTLGAIFTVGVVNGWAAGAFGHELMHRGTRFEWLLAQLLLACCLWTPLALEHVYGHHRNVGLENDVATVRRGVSLWRYLPKALLGVYRGAAAIEARRMRRRGLRVYSIYNRFLQGVAIETALVGMAFSLAGWSGLVAFLLSAAISVLVIESANYIGHYGLVRAPGRPVCPRHSWNAPRFFSTSTLVNLPRHSHHHQLASKPYWELTVLEDAPIYPFGSVVMSTIALCPRLFFAIVDPLLRDWDERLACDEEIALLYERRPGASAAGPTATASEGGDPA
jgi:alkane 1-monooxygenase